MFMYFSPSLSPYFLLLSLSTHTHTNTHTYIYMHIYIYIYIYRDKETCPLPVNCQQKNVVYRATVKKTKKTTGQSSNI